MLKKLPILNCFFFGILSADNATVELFENRPWEFLEFYFIMQPQETSLQKELIKLVPTTILSYISGKLTHEILRSFIPKESYIDSTTNKYDAKLDVIVPMYTILSGLLTACVAYGGIHYYIVIRAQQNALNNFIADWPYYKHVTPEEMHEGFDRLYHLYLKNKHSKVYQQELKRTLKIIIQAIHNHFGAKYIPFQVQHSGHTSQINFNI